MAGLFLLLRLVIKKKKEFSPSKETDNTIEIIKKYESGEGC